MKNILYIVSFFLFVSTMSCTDDLTFQETEKNNKENFTIDEFSNGYSLAFDMSLDPMSDSSTRSDDISDLEITEWENYLDPEEFRILFFDSKDRYLFESRSRWVTQIASQNGGKRWRVGVPVFEYVSDEYDEHISDYEGSWFLEEDNRYNWDRIAEIMRTESFKIAILANRPFNIGLHTLSDFSEDQMKVKIFGKNGPFWGAKNSVASYEFPDDNGNVIKKIFDLHHCQYDPYMENKNNSDGGDSYAFLMEYRDEELKGGGLKNVACMGAVSDWINSNRIITGDAKDNGKQDRYYYKLPHGQILDADEDGKIETYTGTDIFADKNQYIPMYGIQEFAPLTTWTKGTTYNLSQQTASQTGEYDYKYISLLRSVVKLELRIPMYDNYGNEIRINHKWAHICGNNFLARCEPMDIWTPTDQIWEENHEFNCEWKKIKNYGLYCDHTSNNDYNEKLSWYFGIWDKSGNWDFGDVDVVDEKIGETDYPRIFNPQTQRLQRAMITDCYIPIINEIKQQCFHRWIIYCGERNMNDPNYVNDLPGNSYITTFRVEVIRTNNIGAETSRAIYNLPVVDYSNKNNPIWAYYKETLSSDQNEKINFLGAYPQFLEKGSVFYNGTSYEGYYKAVRNCQNPDFWPYPLLRNHHYRLTLSLSGDGEDINVQVINGEKRIVDGIFFK